MNLLSWTFEQWMLANEYRVQLGGEALDIPDLWVAAASYPHGGATATKKLAELQQFWWKRRIDAPGEIKIECTGWKPTRYAVIGQA